MTKAKTKVKTRTKMEKFDRDEYVKFVMEKAKDRARNMNWTIDNEVDFLMGATAVFFHLGIQDKIPAGWIFGPLSGRSVCGIEYEDEEKKRR